MPGNKRRYSVRFPPGRIKKIMQKNAEVGRMAMAVPVIICILFTVFQYLFPRTRNKCETCRGVPGPEPARSARVLEMFLKSLLTQACSITESKCSSVVSVAHMKQCIESEKLFHFLKDLAERASFPTTQEDNRGLHVRPVYRSRSSSSACETTQWHPSLSDNMKGSVTSVGERTAAF
ncbi:dr1-associated corepressor isoform X1 [Nerophis ophidion]|uniref:dr1-associated corepressor isoform X1 n=1 Tax=Nerophis ophidion TaxID=159077 RepID=UPI002ADF15DB|nr:dr1-associated corepressor isoform X1 [Nerophis ophidion]